MNRHGKERKEMGEPVTVIVAKHTQKQQTHTKHKHQDQLWGHFIRPRPKVSEEGTEVEEINMVPRKEPVILLWGQRTSTVVILPVANTHSPTHLLGQFDFLQPETEIETLLSSPTFQSHQLSLQETCTLSTASSSSFFLFFSESQVRFIVNRITQGPRHTGRVTCSYIDWLKTFKSLATHDFFTNLTCEARVHAVSGWYVTVRGPQPGPTEMNRLDAKWHTGALEHTEHHVQVHGRQHGIVSNLFRCLFSYRRQTFNCTHFF